MLHENAKQRLVRMIPEEYDLTWFDPLKENHISETLTIDHDTQVRWAGGDVTPKYPMIYLHLTPEGEPRGDIGYMFKEGIYKEEHADPEIAYTKYTAAPLRSTLRVTVLTDQGVGLIPKRVVADTIAMEVWHEYRFNSDHLGEMGTTPNGEPLEYAWPMEVRPHSDGISDTSRMLDEQAVQRRQMSLRVDYAYFAQEEIPAVQAIEWEFGVRHYNDEDGEVDYHGPYRSEWDGSEDN